MCGALGQKGVCVVVFVSLLWLGRFLLFVLVGVFLVGILIGGWWSWSLCFFFLFCATPSPSVCEAESYPIREWPERRRGMTLASWVVWPWLRAVKRLCFSALVWDPLILSSSPVSTSQPLGTVLCNPVQGSLLRQVFTSASVS